MRRQQMTQNSRQQAAETARTADSRQQRQQGQQTAAAGGRQQTTKMRSREYNSRPGCGGDPLEVSPRPVAFGEKIVVREEALRRSPVNAYVGELGKQQSV
ncbi:hypothetical protein V7S43_000011 [Phytophthora oleae]|uniref:Uncharacterized protein n=1 Tax=Phytophthora oleae TaxID=2107226 RepID=A0ABD3GA92_9STRA